MTDEEHNKYIAWAFLANGLFQLMMLVFIFVFLFFIFALEPPGRGDEFPAAFFAFTFGFAAIINLIFLSPDFIAAYGILKKKPWARIAGIIAAALSAMNVPLGTLAAVYSLWFFCGEQWKSVYPEVAAKGANGGGALTEGEYNPATNWEGYTRDEEGAFVHRTPPPPDWR